MATKRSSPETKLILRTPLSFDGRSTRQRVYQPEYKLASEWVDEYDYYNFSDKWRTNGKMPIFYKLINVFLLFIQFNQPRDITFFYEAIRDILKYYNSDLDEEDEIDSETIIEELLKNIIILYTRLQLFPNGEKLLYTNLLLYHGIHKDSIIHESLLKLTTGAIYELPIFMSTSVTRDVACRFTAESKIIIRITVNEKYLRLFKYIYFGDTLIIGDNNFLTENEFLLNLFTELQFIGNTSEKIIYNSPYIGNTYKKITDTFSIFDMKFIRHSNFTPEEVRNILDKHIEKNRVKVELAQKAQRAQQAQQAQQAPGLMGGRKYKTNNTNKTNKRKYKANKRNKTHKGKIPIKKLSIKYKFKNKKILTKSRKLYKKSSYYTRKNLKNQ
jgi:hypothetical protein